MKLVEMKCKNCGATLNVDADSGKVVCQFCSAEFQIDNEVQHVQYDNMVNSGYEFEKGRIQAQREEQERIAAQQRKEQEEWKRQQEAQRALEWAERQAT